MLQVCKKYYLRHKYCSRIISYLILFVTLLAIIIFQQKYSTAAKQPTIVTATNTPMTLVSELQHSQDIIFQGKLYCSLARSVRMNLNGVVTDIKVKVGQKVNKDEILLTYRLNPEVISSLRIRLAPPVIKEITIKLAKLENFLTTARNKHKEIHLLVEQNMASTENEKQVRDEIASLLNEIKITKDILQQNIQIVQDDIALLKHQIGNEIKNSKLPEQINLRSPIDGYIIFIDSSVRIDSEILQNYNTFIVGVMDPMIIRGQLFENEASQITLGDKATFAINSILDKNFEATVTRLSWTPVTTSLNSPSYYEVELTAPNPALILKEGFKTQVTIHK